MDALIAAIVLHDSSKQLVMCRMHPQRRSLLALDALEVILLRTARSNCRALLLQRMNFRCATL
jgi:hypothetical protein